MRKVEAHIEIHQPAEKVFQAFTELHLLRGWWGVEQCLIEKKQGGIYSLAWDISENGFHYISTGVITVYLPSKELMVDHFVYFNPERKILGPTYLSIRLEESDRITSIQLTQGNYQSGGDWDWYYDAVRLAWPTALDKLKNFLER